jgi:large subunit ribosomal protein L22
MEVKAYLRYLRITPRKTRMIVDMVRGKKISEAETLLKFALRRPKDPILKLLRSAVANAKHNFNLEKEKLFVKEIRVDSGPILKRYMPRARGMASMIRKRTSHISVVLSTEAGDKIKKIS